jgi:ankyrin repeat protein
MTTLLIAAQHGHDGMVRLLLANGAKVDAVNDNGVTALMFATQNGHDGAAAILKEHGAKK